MSTLWKGGVVGVACVGTFAEDDVAGGQVVDA